MKNSFQTREIIIKLLPYIKGKTIDVGAGAAQYKSIISRGASSYTSFDMFPGKNIDVVGDVLNMPFNDNTFDTIVSTQVLEHVEKPWVMVSELYRILKKGGHCILTAPFLMPYHPYPTDFFRFTKDGLSSLFENAGFEIVKVENYGRFFVTLFEIFRVGNFFKKEKNRLLRYLEKTVSWLDRFTKDGNIYPNVYIVAKK